MTIKLWNALLGATALSATFVAGAAPALAQQAAPAAGAANPDASGTSIAPAAAAPATQLAQNDSSDIIVTARKRQETLLNTPVIETAIPSMKLQRLQTTDLKDLTKLAPGLLIGTAVLSIGELVSIRGVGTSSFDPGIDQSVSLNIDGLSLGQGLAYSSGLFDVGQVEVLKGPQALFYGKSSPGGVISIRTADPTDKFEVIARGGYELDAHTRRGELIVSGPITDTLKARVAGMYSKSDGFYYNVADPVPGTGGLAPRDSRQGKSKDYQVRGTVLWDPASAFSARLKLNLAHDFTNDAENFQMTSCPDGISAPLGIPFMEGGEDCKKDRITRVVDMDPAAFPGIKNDGVGYNEVTQKYGTLELNYHPMDGLTATSVSAYYNLRSSNQINTSFTTGTGPAFAVQNLPFKRHDFTEEVRLNSDFNSPLNFTVGGFYQDGHLSDRIKIIGNQALPFGLPPVITDGTNAFSIRSYSAFGQARWKIVDKLELAGGVRYTDETRNENQTLFGAPVVPPTPHIHSAKASPEATLTYKPDSDMTIFASYKQAAKSGSFSIATPVKPTPLDNSFGDERVRGFEGGIKARLLDRQVNVSLTGYDYTYKGLQVGVLLPVVDATPTIETLNAGSGRSYGSELTLTYQPSGIRGLSMNGSLTYNHARFGTLDNAPCYGGQTVAQGCNEQFADIAPTDPTYAAALPDPKDPTKRGFYNAQNLSHSRFIRAPDWQVNFGFDYELPVGDDMKLIFSNSNSYSSKYLTTLGFRSDYYQKSFLKDDLSLTLQGPRDTWEVAVVGKDITNKLTTSSCSSSNFAGGDLGGEITGGNVAGPAGTDEVGCYMDPGRQIWLRVTIRPFG
jgi:iron complex outermembrane receptor protein